MASIYCKKCGIRGDSKCPHHRSIFADRMPDEQDALDRMISVRTTELKDSEGKVRVWAAGKYAGKPMTNIDVIFRTYKDTEEEAMTDILNSLAWIFSADINIEVAACVHEWELMPGVRASIGCCVGPEVVVPADPFEEWKKTHGR